SPRQETGRLGDGSRARETVHGDPDRQIADAYRRRAMIHFEHVTKKYPDGTLAMRDLDLKIEQGEFVSIIGRSGAGKSTMLRLINGMILPSEGKVHVLGHHIGHHESHRKLRMVRREIGFVFQQFNLIETHTVLSNVLMGRVGYMGCVRGVLGM